MNDVSELDPRVVPMVERLLAQKWKGDVRLGGCETLRADKCYRFLITEAPTDMPRSVMVKKARRHAGYVIDPDATEWNPAQRFLEEWAGLAFLNEIAPNQGLCSRLYGGDRSACVIVYEDYGVGQSLLDSLTGDDPDFARECLTLHARTVAELHAATLGHQDRYRQIRDALGPAGIERDSQGWGDLRRLKQDLKQGFELIDQTISPAFWDEYELLTSVIDAPAPFYGYIHNDSCPDNSFLEPGRLRLIDFERGGYHLCLLDAAYCRLCMPHCGYANRLPADVAPMVEQVYRRHLSLGLSAIRDDSEFGRKMTEACAYWIVSNGNWLIKRNFEQDFTWGSATWWQRVFLRLELFAATTEEFAHLPAMGEAARETLKRLKTVWTYEPMPFYPAFR
jgi:thiamine kinase-like enzyme